MCGSDAANSYRHYSRARLHCPQSASCRIRYPETSILMTYLCDRVAGARR